MILNICTVFLNNKKSKMNELKILLTEYQKTHNLTRYTFIQKLGYKNITKGLRPVSWSDLISSSHQQSCLSRLGSLQHETVMYSNLPKPLSSLRSCFFSIYENIQLCYWLIRPFQTLCSFIFMPSRFIKPH